MLPPPNEDEFPTTVAWLVAVGAYWRKRCEDAERSLAELRGAAIQVHETQNHVILRARSMEKLTNAQLALYALRDALSEDVT